MPRGGRERPAAVFGRGLPLALALAVVALVASPAPSPAAPARSSRATTLYHKSRSFRIPFNVDPADRPRLKEVQLYVSEDTGFNWKMVSRTSPDRPSFTFRASRDAEYWFSVRTLDSKGVLYPSDDEKPEPSMKVVVDTSPPTLVLEADGRRGSLAAVRWEVRDEHLDLKSLLLEYQVEGGRDWRTVPIRRPSLLGSESWDAGTAEPLKVRATVEDKAHNVTEQVISLSEGTPSNPSVAAGESAEFSPPPVSQISSGPTFPARDAPARLPASSSPAADPFPFPPPDMLSSGPPSATPPTAPASPPAGGEFDPFNGPGPGTASVAPGASQPAAEAGAPPAQPILVPSPRFPLQYAVEDAGPNGPATVELWVTDDGGQRWSRKGEDTDKVSPFPVDLGGEGTFGLRLVARAASGLGDTPPGSGDAPQMIVEVDSTPPAVTMLPALIGAGPHVGKVAIKWKATDVHLAAKPVVISWRPADQPGARWQPITEPIENSGQFNWVVPATIPPRFHLRVDVIDTAGNRGYAETSEGAPVVVDRTRPRSRIIGLDPRARGRAGAGALPLR
jgi:hypothetical protein